MSDLTPRTQHLADSDVVSVAIGENVAVEVEAEAPPPPKGGATFIGKSPGQLAWTRLKRDKVGMISGYVVLGFIVIGIMAPLVELIYGYGPNVFDSSPAHLRRCSNRLRRRHRFHDQQPFESHPHHGCSAGHRPRHLHAARLRLPDLAVDRVHRFQPSR